MGNTASSPEPKAAAVPAGVGACPVMHKGAAAPPAQAETAASSSGCPVLHKNKKVYNVYSQEINPDNMMPVNPNQFPNQQQTKPIDTTRVKSTIPKGGTDDQTWTYPSPQMFYNSLKRKGKGDDVTEDDVDAIVAVHNNMNEQTWGKVMEFEAMHCDECEKSMLLRFIGKPDELSPKAWFKTKILGGPEPFDRHDWTIDRCGKEVRYIIDYYYDEQKSAQDKMPHLHDASSVKSISFDVRPALDSVEAAIDRVKMGYRQMVEQSESSTPSGDTPAVAPPTDDAKAVALREFQQKMIDIQQTCQSAILGVDTCNGEVECSQAQMALNFCMGKLVCEAEATRFNAALNKDSSGKEADESFTAMTDCLQKFGEQGSVLLD